MAWFLTSGVLRLLIGTVGVLAAVLLTALLDIAALGFVALGAVAVYALAAFAIAPALCRAAAENRLRVLVGRSTGAVRAFRVLAIAAFAGFFLGAVVFGLFAPGVSLWIGERGGGGALYLTCSLVLLAALALSAAARLLCTPIAVSSKARSWLSESAPARSWETFEAGALLCCLLLCAYGIVLGVVGADRAVTRVDEAGVPIRPGSPTGSLALTPARELLIGLAPVISLTSREGWYPQRVDNYLRESEVTHLDGRLFARAPQANELRGVACPQAGRPCLVVRNDSCPESDACREWRLGEFPGEVLSDPRVVAYTRVARRGWPSGRGISWDVPDFESKLIGIAQWWLFAPYNEWTTPLGVVVARLYQRHAADWEAITVGFAADRPLFVALSAHCGGSWRRFEHVDVPNLASEKWDPLGGRLHPIAAYADGSHALYFEPESGRQPDSVGCEQEAFSGLLGPTAYATNIRDRTGDQVNVILTPVTGAEARRVLRFPAYWGQTEELVLDAPVVGSSQVRGTMQEPKGPSGPGTKAQFRDPIDTIFCRRTWHYDGPGSPPAADCP